MTPLAYIVILATTLFLIGACGIVLRRNVIAILMCIELMLNAANILFVAFANHHQAIDGQVATCFVMVIATAEAAVGLGLVLALVRNRCSVESDDAQLLKG